MLNTIWAFMILIGVIYAACTGRMGAVTNAAVDSAGEAISLCITMAGVMAFWMGLMEIAQRAGIIEKMTNGISPFLNVMFPKIPSGHPARGYIATNIIANVLGLGWACTPAGLKAMEELEKLEEERRNAGSVECSDWSKKKEPEIFKKQEFRHKGGQSAVQKGTASNEMCTFLVLNISSLQLIPVNIIAYRSQYGSVNPTAVVGPGIVATLCSTLVAVVFCKIMTRKRRC